MPERNSGWKNWGDHPIIVFISAGSAILGVILTIVGLMNIKNNDESANPVILSPAPTINQQHQQEQQMPAPQPTLPTMTAEAESQKPSEATSTSATIAPPEKVKEATNANRRLVPNSEAAKTPRREYTAPRRENPDNRK